MGVHRLITSIALSSLLCAGCQTTAPRAADVRDCGIPIVSTSEPAAQFAGAKAPNDVHWYRVSAERALLYAQTYRAACAAVHARAANLAGRAWAVVLDADETILDNSEFQARLALSGASYDDGLWALWVKERRAPLLPGAREFVDEVRRLGGRAVIVTNRDEALCEDTRANFAARGLAVDAMLCKAATSDKNARFQSIRDGSAAPGLEPLDIVAVVGDNIGDFPNESQASRNGSRFGVDYFLLPNPMYGSFQEVTFH